jgi:transposase-like protein
MENELTIPQTLKEAIVMFSDKAYAHTIAAMFVWPDGEPVCHRCGSKNAHFMPAYFRYRCRDCRKDFTVKNGTIFEDSPLGLDQWLAAIWFIANCKNGISSYELGRDLGVTQRTAWFMLHRIREAMKDGSFQKMEGTIEADETFVGGLEKNKHENKKLRQGRGAVGKAIVQGVIERGQTGRKSRVAAKVVKGTDAETLQDNVKNYVVTGSYVYTDAHKGYNGLGQEFVHDFIDHTVTYANGVVHTNGMENFWSLLKRGIKGTYVAVMPFHLDRYVDEQAYRFNERGTNDAGRFLKVLSQVSGKRLTWIRLTESSQDFYGWMFQYR